MIFPPSSSSLDRRGVAGAQNGTDGQECEFFLRADPDVLRKGSREGVHLAPKLLQGLQSQLSVGRDGPIPCTYYIPHSQFPRGRHRYVAHMEPTRAEDMGGRGALGTLPAAVHLLPLISAERHALGPANDKLSRATLSENKELDAFWARLRSLSELCGNIHSEETLSSS